MRSTDQFVAALEARWRQSHGSALVPSEIALESVAVHGGTAEVLVTRGGIRFGFRARIPAADAVANPMEPEAGTPEHWAIWDIIVPLIEEIETDAEGRIVPDHLGIRWV
ncbi:hypothetical protein [Microbacterium hydrocarbonoxydans]|uniref:hypothetical protein n=1 Tax=Microbacterium hydrocarbonoxydans TaxID=273678 RepID=UPI003D96E4D4